MQLAADAMLRCFVLLAICSLAKAWPVGVAPQEAGRYPAAESSSPFKCFDESADIPAASVNDNYCDCPDGSDEPGTPACAGRLRARFYCRNSGSVPKLLYTSRVRDGICDCCDGSDELPSNWPCSNTCETEGAAVRAEQDRRRLALIEGLKVQEQSAGAAQAASAQWQAELRALEEELPGLEEAETAAQALADEVRQSSTEGSQADVELSQGTALLEEDFDGPGDAMERWHVAEGGSAKILDDPKGQRGKVLATDGCTWGGDTFSVQGFMCNTRSRCKISFWARGAPWQGVSRGAKRTEEAGADAHSWLAVPAMSGDFPDRVLSTQSTDNWVHYEYEFPAEEAFQMLGSEEVSFSSGEVHIMVQAHDSTGFCGETMFDSFRVWKDDGSVAFVDSEGDRVEFQVNTEGRVDVLANGEVMVQDVKSLRNEGLFLHFGGYRAKAPNKAIVSRALALFQGQQTSPQAHAEDRQSTKPEVSEYAKWALDEVGSKVEPASSDEDLDEESSADGTNWYPVDKKGNSEGESDAVKRAVSALEAARKRLREQKRKRDELQSKLKNVQHSPRWYSLMDACVEKRIEQYNYKICFFGEAKQDYVSLGTFSGWEIDGGSVLLFTNGQYCPGGPARTLRLQLVCGREGSITDVTEPSRCSYAAEVVHPSACRREDLEELETETEHRMLLPHEEL